MRLSSGKYANISISTDTLIMEDIVKRILEFMANVHFLGDIDDRTLVKIKDLVDEILKCEGNMSETALELYDVLFNVMNDIAPEYCYFGSHHGDGADIGFWTMENDDEEISTDVDRDVTTDSKFDKAFDKLAEDLKEKGLVE